MEINQRPIVLEQCSPFPGVFRDFEFPGHLFTSMQGADPFTAELCLLRAVLLVAVHELRHGVSLCVLELFTLCCLGRRIELAYGRAHF